MSGDAYRQAGPVRDLISNWDFVPSEPRLWMQMLRIASVVRLRPRPQHLAITPLRPRPSWIVYFVYVPDGRLTASHRFALGRFRDMGCGVFVVCAAKDPAGVPAELRNCTDALYWKALSGYDFSAYTLALEAISRDSPHARVCIVNDSVLGPFSDLRPFMDGAAWDLSGFTASSHLENHIQSYAFMLSDVHDQRLEQLSSAFPKKVAFSHGRDVVRGQELRFARVAAHHMKVGAYWYAQEETVVDPMLYRPFELLEVGFPFMKRSLLGKMSQFQHRDEVLEVLSHHRHPTTD